MKRAFILVLSFLLCIRSLSTFAAEKASVENTTPQVTEDNSTPRFMVTGYELKEKNLRPGKEGELKISFKNYSSKKAIYNIKLSIKDSSGEIITVGMPTKYVSFICADSTYHWTVKLTASKLSQIGTHDLEVLAEYEDKNFSSYSSSDTIRVDVHQTVNLDFDGAILPSKVIEGETQSVTLNLMNTGKSTIYNCKINFDINSLTGGGTVFVGEIAPGESKTGSGNLRVSEGTLGEVKGTITISYEDPFGSSYEKTVDVETVIERKIPLADTAEENEEKKNGLWWLFILIGLLVGGAAGFGIPWFIKDRRQRKEDELRL